MFLSCQVRFSERCHTLHLLECQEPLARNRRYIWNLSDYNENRTQNILVFKRTLNHLAKQAKWLNSVVSKYMYGGFNCMFLSCDAHVSEWIHTLYLSQCQRTPCSKRAPYWKLKWLQRDSNSQPLSS